MGYISRLVNDLTASISELAIRSRSVTLFTEMDHKAHLVMQSAKAVMISFDKAEKELTSMIANGQGTVPEAALMVEISQAAKKVFSEVAAALAQAQDGDTVATV